MSFTDEEIARIAHEANRALQQVLGDEQISPPWDQASDEDHAVSAAGVKIARYGAPPRVLHDVWMREKLAAGWTYGEVKDAEAKTHPLLVDFDNLPPAEQAKDYLFSGVCVAMNAASDVKTRAENEQLKLADAEKLVAAGGGNQALTTGAMPFDGLPPVLVQVPAQPPAQPDTAEE
jgi:hypothetical protein